MHRMAQGLTQAHIAHHMMTGQIRARGLQKHHDVIIAPISRISSKLMRERQFLRKRPTQKSLRPHITEKKRKAIPQPFRIRKVPCPCRSLARPLNAPQSVVQ